MTTFHLPYVTCLPCVITLFIKIKSITGALSFQIDALDRCVYHTFSIQTLEVILLEWKLLIVPGTPNNYPPENERMSTKKGPFQ